MADNYCELLQQQLRQRSHTPQLQPQLAQQAQQSAQQQQQFLLRWHRHAATLTGALPELLRSGVFADVTLALDANKCVRAHKLVLASCSRYFCELFQNLDPNENAVVIVPQCTLAQMQSIMEFIYTGQCRADKCQLEGIFSIAHTLKIHGLSSVEVQQSTNELNNNFNNSNNNNFPSSKHSSKKSIPQITPLETIKCQPPSIITKRASTHGGSGGGSSTETCKCFICGKYLSNQYNLRVHIETHKETYHACSACAHVSRSRDALRKHVSYRHPENYAHRKRMKPLPASGATSTSPVSRDSPDTVLSSHTFSVTAHIAATEGCSSVNKDNSD